MPSGLASGGILLTLHREQESKIIIMKNPTTFCLFPERFRRQIHLEDGRTPGVCTGKTFSFVMVAAGEVPGFEAEWVGRLI